MSDGFGDRPPPPAAPNPTSPMGMWLLTYRDKSALDGAAVGADATREAADPRRHAELAQFAAAHAALEDDTDDTWASFLGRAFTPQRFLVHGLQMTQAYLGIVAPTTDITDAAGLTAAELLGRNTIIARRTAALAGLHPHLGFGQRERAVWERDPGWQQVRRVAEAALVTYDWAECLFVTNVLIRPCLDAVLVDKLAGVCRQGGDPVTATLLDEIASDQLRASRWSLGVLRQVTHEQPKARDVLARWARRWSKKIDEAIDAAAGLIEGAPLPVDRGACVTAAKERRREGLATLELDS